MAITPFLSVVIPVYNGEKYLAHAVRSVLLQPCTNVEVVCINDGSSDNSEHILLELSREDTRVRWFTQDNQGVAAARNHGVEHAKGQYVAFLDQDDFWCDDFLTEQCIEKIAADYYDLVSFASYSCNQDATRFSFATNYDGVIKDVQQHLRVCFRHHSSFFYKRDFLLNNQLQTDGYRNEDIRFLAACCCVAGSMLMVNRPSFVYRNNTFSVTHNKTRQSRVLQSCCVGYYVLEKNTTNIQLIKFARDMRLCILLQWVEALAKEGRSLHIIQTTMNDNGFEELYSSVWMSDMERKKWELLKNHPRCFWVINRLQGYGERLLRRLLHLPIIRKWYEAKKYPLTTI